VEAATRALQDAKDPRARPGRLLASGFRLDSSAGRQRIQRVMRRARPSATSDRPEAWRALHSGRQAIETREQAVR
jgi:hypothetical protein